MQREILCFASGTLAMLMMAAQAVSYAQGVPPTGPQLDLPTAPQGPPPTPRAQAPFDPTGYWVSLVTEDWRFRMVVPGRGEYSGISLSLAAKQFADAWTPGPDEAAGKQCEAYGAAVVMVVPERLHITWKDDDTLQVQTDAGLQTRSLHFGPMQEPLPERSWQGYSHATWLMHQGPPNIGAGPPAQAGPPKRYGQLKVTTNDMLAGLIRKNGMPYSDQSALTEYWELDSDPATQMQYLIVSATLDDPVYLIGNYSYTAQFEKEQDDSKWAPTPCTLTAMP